MEFDGLILSDPKKANPGFKSKVLTEGVMVTEINSWIFLCAPINLHRLTNIGQQETRKMLSDVMSLDFCSLVTASQFSREL